jgi:hypothetical protein
MYFRRLSQNLRQSRDIVVMLLYMYMRIQISTKQKCNLSINVREYRMDN